MRSSNTLRASVVVLAAVLLCGCGKKGRLYLPEQTPAASAAAVPSPADPR